jgi:hypothetical protein
VPPTHSEKANALVPGDWSSLRDVIRDIADDLDKLKASPGRGAVADTAPGANPTGSGAGPDGGK